VLANQDRAIDNFEIRHGVNGPSIDPRPLVNFWRSRQQY
jgi:hypothetical protein